MDQRRRLVLDRPGQVGVAVAQKVDRDAGREIEVLLAIFAIEVDPLPSNRTRVAAGIDGHQRRYGHGLERPWSEGEKAKRRPWAAWTWAITLPPRQGKKKGRSLLPEAPPFIDRSNRLNCRGGCHGRPRSGRRGRRGHGRKRCSRRRCYSRSRCCSRCG